MNDKEMKIMRYREENKAAKRGETVFAGSSLMEMFPISKLLREHNDGTVLYNRGKGWRCGTGSGTLTLTKI